MNAMGVNPEENTDNTTILLKMENGSIGVINYFSNASKGYSKERVEFFSISKSPTHIDGYDPYPISLRIINWVKFLSRCEIHDEIINRQL